MLTVSSSLLRLTSLLHECCKAPKAVLWPFTLMSLIRTSVPTDGSMLLLRRSWEGFLTVGALVLTLAPFLPSDSQRPFQKGREPHVVPSGIQSRREGGGPNGALQDLTSEEFLLDVFLFLFYPYPVLYRAVVTNEASFVSLQCFYSLASAKLKRLLVWVPWLTEHMLITFRSIFFHVWVEISGVFVSHS